jgi:hypothetical protein
LVVFHHTATSSVLLQLAAVSSGPQSLSIGARAAAVPAVVQVPIIPAEQHSREVSSGHKAVAAHLRLFSQLFLYLFHKMIVFGGAGAHHTDEVEQGRNLCTKRVSLFCVFQMFVPSLSW